MKRPPERWSIVIAAIAAAAGWRADICMIAVPRRAFVVLEPRSSEHDGGASLIYVDLHLVHEVTSAQAFEGLRLAGRKVRRPDRTLATADHNVPTEPRERTGLDAIADHLSRDQVAALEHTAPSSGYRSTAWGAPARGSCT